jgi:hypothetical protein
LLFPVHTGGLNVCKRLSKSAVTTNPTANTFHYSFVAHMYSQIYSTETRAALQHFEPFQTCNPLPWIK